MCVAILPPLIDSQLERPRYQELNLLHQRIGSLKSLRLERFAKHLKRLCLRQNFISFLDPEVFSLLTEMEELDFYDNKLKTVGDALNTMSKLT